jgi:hypothetical protein
MPDLRRIVSACLAASALLLGGPLLTTATHGAQQGPTNTIHVSPGTEVHVSGNHVMVGRLGGGAGDKGGYACECPTGGKGECTISSTGGNLGCGPTTSNGCDKACVFAVYPGAAARRATGGQAAP